MPIRILVTGGFGYVGGRLVQSMSDTSRYKVYIGSRYDRAIPVWAPSAVTRSIDWDNVQGLRNLCSGVDIILHLAGVNAEVSANDTVLALQINAVNTARLVEAASMEKVGLFVYFSTAHVYCSPLRGHIDETYCPKPVHPYATSHRAGEDVVLSAHERGWFSGTVVRLSNAFGAPTHLGVDSWTLLVNDLCRQAVTTGMLRLRSSGIQRRDFITLTDVCRATDHLVGLAGNMLGTGIFNVGGSWTPTVLEMANLVKQRCELTLGFSPEIFRPEFDPGEQSLSLEYSIDKLLGTGFCLTQNIDEEIDNTLRMCAV
jgi:UDP-glucose 4-epimerase